MPLFKKPPDSLSLTMALVEAVAREDAGAIAEARESLAPVSTLEVLHSLFRFGHLICSRLKPEQQDVVRVELAAAEGPLAMKAAVEAVGGAVLLQARQDAVTKAVNRHFASMASAPDDAIRRAVLEIVNATGRICRRLDITLNWK